MKMDWKANFLTKDDLDRVLEESRRKKAWGRWTLDKKVYPSLDIHPYSNNSPYQVPLFKLGCDFSTFLAWLGHWTQHLKDCLLYTSPSPRDGLLSRMPSSA